jgi:hypothetical protein
MEMHYGGPVWHVSIAFHGTVRPVRPGEVSIPVARLSRAIRALSGVGDPARGQWVEDTPRATHVRRRLSDAEAVGMALRDIRGTPEVAVRLAPVAHLLPPGYSE